MSSIQSEEDDFVCTSKIIFIINNDLVSYYFFGKKKYKIIGSLNKYYIPLKINTICTHVCRRSLFKIQNWDVNLKQTRDGSFSVCNRDKNWLNLNK